MSENDETKEAIEGMAELTPDELDGISGGVIDIIDGGTLSYQCPGCWAIIEADSLASLRRAIDEHEAVCPGPPFKIN